MKKKRVDFEMDSDLHKEVMELVGEDGPYQTKTALLVDGCKKALSSHKRKANRRKAR